ncbi:MAG: hypothetical protein KDB13_04025 [Microthrixaceae bacterium]|nr:hypothetical protein [Microthrixaceae bacterium]
MSRPTRYEIEIRGRATDRVLRPVIDDFEIDPTDVGTTRLTGLVRDPSHLNGLLAHFTSMNVEVVQLRRIDPPPTDLTDSVSTNQHTNPERGIQP